MKTLTALTAAAIAVLLSTAAEAAEPGVGIKSFSATRIGNQIRFAAVINNTAATQAPNMTYTISRIAGPDWIKFKEGGSAVAAQGSVDVFAELPNTNAAVQYILQVAGPGKYEKRIVSLPAVFAAPAKKKVFVVSYSTNGWVHVAEQKQSGGGQLIGEAARKKAKSLNALGFKTRTKITTTTSLFSTSYRTMVYAQALTRVTREFQSKQEADEFSQSLRQSMKNLSPGTNGHPLTFLSIFRSEKEV